MFYLVSMLLFLIVPRWIPVPCPWEWRKKEHFQSTYQHKTSGIDVCQVYLLQWQEVFSAISEDVYKKKKHYRNNKAMGHWSGNRCLELCSVPNCQKRWTGVALWSLMVQYSSVLCLFLFLNWFLALSAYLTYNRVRE